VVGAAEWGSGSSGGGGVGVGSPQRR